MCSTKVGWPIAFQNNVEAKYYCLKPMFYVTRSGPKIEWDLGGTVWKIQYAEAKLAVLSKTEP